MIAQKTYWKQSLILFLLLLIFVAVDLTLGSKYIAFTDVLNGVFNYNETNSNELIVRVFRFPRVVTAVLAGVSLSTAGLLLQTLFQNPLAAPYVLGINSGASLLVALSTMSSFVFFQGAIGTVGAAMLGAFLAGILILLTSIYVKNKVSLLLVGIMLGSFAGAMVNVVQAYANPNDLKMFMLWSFGSLQGIEFHQLGGVTAIVFIGILLSFLLVKPLNLLLLGDKNASLLGINVKQIRVAIVLITAILTGVVTAYCGPVAFVGLVVPNMVKLIYKTANHYQLLIGSIFGGAFLVVLCDIVMQLLSSFLVLPLNALTAIIGAPVVIWIIVRRF